MANPINPNLSDMEIKYQKLAMEYSKVRSQASVLKKALLDEQGKNVKLNELIKNHEQTIRKHDQEMESLIFRNEQLKKRVFVLQHDLEMNNKKKSKQKSTTENPDQIPNFNILDEELQKKILENATLLCNISDKDIEIRTSRERIEFLEEKLKKTEDELFNREKEHIKLISELKQPIETNSVERNVTESNCNDESCEKHWQKIAEKFKYEYELLKNTSTTNCQLVDYYESNFKILDEAKHAALTESKSLSAENQALKSRLEYLDAEHNKLKNKFDENHEELTITNANYQTQLDAMTEHLAAQNEKITKQCDEIQILKHKLSNKKV